MKKAYLITTILLLPILSVGQQVTQYTQYIFDHFNLNPAVAGSKECLDFHAGYRTQWVGFPGAPRSVYATAHSQLPQKKKFLDFKHGIGGKIENDQAGPFSYNSAYLAYAFHLPLTSKITGSAGLYAGFKQFSFNADQVTLNNYQDPAIDGSKVLYVIPDITPGIWLYSDSYYVGLSVRQLLGNKLSGIGDNSSLSNHFSLVGGKEFKHPDQPVTFTPSALIKWAPASSPAFDINLLTEFKERLAVGLSYRNIDAVAALLRVNFLKYFSLGYSFDFTTSRIRTASSNTHEVTLGIYACSQYGNKKTTCPAYY